LVWNHTFFEVFDWGESFGDVKGPHD
jgi:hypothetical protein